MIARLARFGAGWIPWGDAGHDLAASIPVMRERVAALGRDPDGLGVVGTIVVAPDVVADQAVAAVPDLVAAGVTDVRLFMPMPPSRAELLDRLGGLAAAFRAVTGRAAVGR